MVRVVASVIRRDDRLLICRRAFHKRHGGLWEFPGGKCENGESDFAAVCRELAEELGVKVLSVGPEIFSIQDPGSQFVIGFLPVEICGEPKCIEHSAMTWARPQELNAMPLAPSDRSFLDYLGGDL